MKKIMMITFVIIFLPIVSFAQGLENYIIQNDIGVYKFRPKPTKEIYGNSGVVISADHFDEDHDDITYETEYIKPQPILGVEIQITQHAGADSDKWLLHEVDADFRNGYGIPGQAYGQRKINGQSILEAGYRIYRWLSGNKVINIEYTADDQNKPEPLEIVQAYLSKFPSTITPLTLKELRSDANVTKWIKDEMERRLWLCDKWSMQLQLGKVTQAEMLQALVKHMTVFLNYRQKYLSQYVEKDKTAEKEITALSTYLTANDGTSIKAKLTEYKTWWTANKSKSISL